MIPAPRRLAAFAVILALPLALAGCGVRGALEPPPSAAVEPVENGKPAARRPPGSPNVGTTSAAVVEAPAARRRSPLDLLID